MADAIQDTDELSQNCVEPDDLEIDDVSQLSVDLDILPPGIEVPVRDSSSTYHTPIPKAIGPGEPCILGVDEAGRGPVLGAMVYALSYCLKSYSEKLPSFGFADSKQLTHATRMSLFSRMCNSVRSADDCQLFDNVGWATRIMTARDISSGMLRSQTGRVYNLNEQAHDATMALISQVLANGVNVTEIYVDTVGPPAPYQAKLSRYFPGIKVIVTKKADSLFPIVSVASICAKVTRDISLKYRDESDGTWGSGYPSDGKTTKWLKDSLDPIFGWGPVVRFSWQTSKDLLEKNKAAIKVDWDDQEKTDIRLSAFQSSGYWFGNLVTSEF
ncbi:ribonuclease HII-domain-containing protein [Lipomyces kononenkoae]|uniref:Ribonuclease HII-domain-containing protein n=1 Tax=Lipomyces kononenkoae TaxID=34357 RepID=A0ACC3T9L3_LIPKO